MSDGALATKLNKRPGSVYVVVGKMLVVYESAHPAGKVEGRD